MGKAKLGLLLAGAYAFGLVLLLAIVVSLPRGTFCAGLRKVPQMGHRAFHLARVAVHAGSLGLRHLPAALEPQGLFPQHRGTRFCTREAASNSCGSSSISPPESLLAPSAPIVVRVLVLKDG